MSHPYAKMYGGGSKPMLEALDSWGSGITPLMASFCDPFSPRAQVRIPDNNPAPSATMQQTATALLELPAYSSITAANKRVIQGWAMRPTIQDNSVLNTTIQSNANGNAQAIIGLCDAFLPMISPTTGTSPNFTYSDYGGWQCKSFPGTTGGDNPSPVFNGYWWSNYNWVPIPVGSAGTPPVTTIPANTLPNSPNAGGAPTPFADLASQKTKFLVWAQGPYSKYMLPQWTKLRFVTYALSVQWEGFSATSQGAVLDPEGSIYYGIRQTDSESGADFGAANLAGNLNTLIQKNLDNTVFLDQTNNLLPNTSAVPGGPSEITTGPVLGLGYNNNTWDYTTVSNNCLRGIMGQMSLSAFRTTYPFGFLVSATFTSPEEKEYKDLTYWDGSSRDLDPQNMVGAGATSQNPNYQFMPHNVFDVAGCSPFIFFRGCQNCVFQMNAVLNVEGLPSATAYTLPGIVEVCDPDEGQLDQFAAAISRHLRSPFPFARPDPKSEQSEGAKILEMPASSGVGILARLGVGAGEFAGAA